MRQRIDINILLEENLSKMVDKKEIKKSIIVDISELNYFFERKAINEIFNKLYYFFYLYSLCTKKEMIDIRKIKCQVAFAQTKNKNSGLVIHGYVISDYKVDCMTKIMNFDGSEFDYIPKDINNKIDSVNELSIMTQELSFETHIKEDSVFVDKHVFESLHQTLFPILKDLSCFVDGGQISAKYFFMTNSSSKYPVIACKCEYKHKGVEYSKHFDFINVENTKKSWMQQIHKENILNVKELWSEKDFCNQSNYDIILNNLKILNY